MQRTPSWLPPNDQEPQTSCVLLLVCLFCFVVCALFEVFNVDVRFCVRLCVRFSCLFRLLFCCFVIVSLCHVLCCFCIVHWIGSFLFLCSSLCSLWRVDVFRFIVFVLLCCFVGFCVCAFFDLLIGFGVERIMFHLLFSTFCSCLLFAVYFAFLVAFVWSVFVCLLSCSQQMTSDFDL